MARPKELFTDELAERAKADLESLDPKQFARKLLAIISASKYPMEIVADIAGVSSETIWRWATAYKKSGVEGLYPKPKRPKPSKLNPDQKTVVLSWLRNGKSAKGKDVHWTLDRLRQAVIDEFGITLGRHTIWVWIRKEGFKPKVPRPKHYEANEQVQKDFKKNSKPE